MRTILRLFFNVVDIVAAIDKCSEFTAGVVGKEAVDRHAHEPGHGDSGPDQAQEVGRILRTGRKDYVQADLGQITSGDVGRSRRRHPGGQDETFRYLLSVLTAPGISGGSGEVYHCIGGQDKFYDTFL